LIGMTHSRRPLLRTIFEAAVARAHPDRVLAQHLPAPPKGRIICLAAGKGGAAMAAAAERHYLDTCGLPAARLAGLATTRHGHACPTRQIEVVEAGHPVPDAASQRAAERSLQLALSAAADDLVLVLLSGGGSANWIAPADGVSLEQKQEVNRALLRSGANIGAINTVRKHLSRIKGGRLARAAFPARVLTLAISDVPNDDPAVIASGPTVADPTTLADARGVLTRFGIIPHAAIQRALDDPANESCKAGDPALAQARFSLIARPRDALDSAVATAQAAGFAIADLGELEGEAREVAQAHAKLARDAHAAGRRVAILSGGELTVTVRGRGRGGPNQEYVLALVSAVRDLDGIAALAADTDGADGGGGSPSDPAGAFFDAATLRAIDKAGLDADSYLANNDATSLFEQTGDLLTTGPTLTNVNDIRVLLVDPR
jgi:hydroxypyruvate reductase